jgi:PKD repeat protein
VVSSCNYVNKKRLIWEFGFPSAVRGEKVTKAELAAYQTNAYDCDTGWVRAYRVNSISSSTNWSNHHSHWDGTDLSLDSVDETRRSGCPLGPGWTRWDVTSGAQLAANNSWSTLTLGVRSANETSMPSSWKRFRYDATLSITYNSYPNKPGLPSLNSSVTYGTGPSGYLVRDLTPTLYATVSDPDSGQTVRGLFEVYQGSTKKWSGQTSLFASGTKVSITVASGTLVENTLYTVRVWAIDNGGLKSKTWSDYIQFKIDVTAPNAKPGVAPVDGQPAVYVEDEWAGGVGRLGKFTFTNGGVSDVKSYRYSFNSDTLTNSIAAGTGTGGPATVSFTPDRIGPQTLYVQSVDQVGLTGPTMLYRFNVEFPRVGAWWPLNEGTGAAATDAVAGQVLSLTGATWVDGPLAEYGIDPADRALSFSGSPASRGETTAPVIGTQDSFSVMAWAKPAALPSSLAVAVSQDGTTDYGFKLGITNTSCASANGLCWGFWSTNAPVGGGAAWAVSSDVPVDADAWVLLAGVYEAAAGQMRLYACPAGGEPAGPATTAHQIGWTATGPLRVGVGQSGSSLADPWHGVVDDVRIYDSVIDLHMIRRGCPGEDPGAPNELPTAAFDVVCDYLTCTFDAVRSNDPDGTLTGYEWDFGDGSPAATGALVQHTFSQSGVYTATLTVTDDRGGQDTTTSQVGGPTVLQLGPTGYAQTPDHSALDITGAIDIRIDVEPETWTPGERQVLASKGNYYGDLSWALTLGTDSSLSFLWSFNGTTDPLHHVVSFPTEGAGRKTVRVTLASDGASGAYVDFYLGDSINGPWVHKGRHHRAEPPTIYASSAPLLVGANPDLWWPEFAGRVYQTQIRNGVNGPLAAAPDFTSLWQQETSFADSAGRAWTLSATDAEVVFQ